MDYLSAEPVSRRTLVLFYVVDTSGSMSGGKISSMNIAVRETIPEIADISANNADAKIKIAVLKFSSGTEWLYPEPVDSENFNWYDLESGGLTDLGAACLELNNKLSTKAYMNEAAGSYAPAILLFSDGGPTDDYKRGIEKLKQNNWFKSSIKIAIAIGEDCDKNVLAEFTGNNEAVITVHDTASLKKIIRFVSVTASQVASRSASVGGDNAPTKEQELIDKIKDNVADIDKTIDVGADTAPSAQDDWGSW